MHVGFHACVLEYHPSCIRVSDVTSINRAVAAVIADPILLQIKTIYVGTERKPLQRKTNYVGYHAFVLEYHPSCIRLSGVTSINRAIAAVIANPTFI